MNNNKTMKYNKTQEINYKATSSSYLWIAYGPKSEYLSLRILVARSGMHEYPGIKMLTSQMHYSCLTAEPENKRRPSRQRELGSNLLSLFLPQQGPEWRTKRMHAHVNSPSASARKLGKRVRKIVEKLVGIGVGWTQANDMNLPHGSEKCAKSEKSVGEKGGIETLPLPAIFLCIFPGNFPCHPPPTNTCIHTHTCAYGT